MITRNILWLAAAVATIGSSSAQERQFFDDASLEHLTSLSSDGFEAKPDISHDLLTLHFASSQAGGAGDLDLWRATRATKDSPFGTQVNVAELNSPERDHTPTTNSDGTLMIFSSNRIGTLGSDDAWVTTRPGPNATWGAPQNLAVLNSTDRDMGFTMTPDGLCLYYTSNRPGGSGGFDLYMSTRASTDADWSAPTPVSELNTPFDDKFPSVTGDNLTLFFASNRPGSVPTSGGVPSLDLWVAMREDTSSPWSVVENVFEVNTEHSEYLMSVADDHSELFFVSDRPGTLGGFDLYRTDAVPFIWRYGAGIAGEAGIPRIRPTGGETAIGNANFAWEFTNITPNATGVYFISLFEDSGPILLVGSPIPFIGFFQDKDDNNPPADVPRVISSPVPNDANLIGVVTRCQVLMAYDPGGEAKISGVNISTSYGVRREIHAP